MVCPICNSANGVQIFEAKDFSVSGELFKIVECESCAGRYTVNPPSNDLLSNYYQSEAYISHSNTNAGLINKLYLWVRNFTIFQKRKLIEKISLFPKGSLLDVGSGTGYFAGAMKKAGWEVTAIEPDESTRSRALDLNNIELKTVQDFFQLSAEQFDVITLWHVLEHVPSLKTYIQELQKLLKKNGKLVIAVPNFESFDAGYFQQYWAAYDVPRHLYHFNYGSIKLLFEGSGMKLEKIQPQWFDSFYISLLSTKYKFKSTKWFLAIAIGVWSNLLTLFNSQKCSSVVYIFSK